MSNDPKNLIIPHGWLKGNVIIPAANPELPASYAIDFGQFQNASIDIGGEIKENYTGLDGIIGLDNAQRVKATLTYGADAKYIAANIMDYIFGGAGTNLVAGVTPEIGKVYDLFCWFGMQAQKEKIQADGSGLFVHHSFKAGITFDGPFTLNGEDHFMSKLTARVYLGGFPGKWSRATVRPLPLVP